MNPSQHHGLWRFFSADLFGMSEHCADEDIECSVVINDILNGVAHNITVADIDAVEASADLQMTGPRKLRKLSEAVKGRPRWMTSDD